MGAVKLVNMRAKVLSVKHAVGQPYSHAIAQFCRRVMTVRLLSRRLTTAGSNGLRGAMPTPVSNVTTGYASTLSGTYDSYGTASAGAANTYRFIRITASADAPTTFLQAIPGVSKTYTVTAFATAGQQGLTTAANGVLLPFA